MTGRKFTFAFLIINSLLFAIPEAFAQEEKDTSNKSTNVYRPYSQRMRLEDSLAGADTHKVISIEKADSLDPLLKARLDSIAARQKFVEDSIAAREQFIRDSLIARERFVRDSLLRRKQIKDSVNFLARALPPVLASSVYAMNDDIVLFTDPIEVIGDSILTDYHYIKLPNRFTDPYVPWKGSINLSSDPPVMVVDTINHIIETLKAPGINDIYTYNKGKSIISIKRQGRFASKHGRKYYKAPIDSVFFNNQGRVIKVKRYYKLYQATANFQLGSELFDFKWQVKQYGYTGKDLAFYEVTRFCERWAKSEPEKVCNIARHSFTKIGYSYEVVRTNDPTNIYSDGTYRYEFDNLKNLKSVAFRNVKNSENWKTFIELNDKGLVSRYVYQDKGIVNKTLLVNYYLDDPNAKHKVETVTCTFEDDGISYFQHNNTTGKSRARDKFTGIWGPWE